MTWTFDGRIPTHGEDRRKKLLSHYHAMTEDNDEYVQRAVKDAMRKIQAKTSKNAD